MKLEHFMLNDLRGVQKKYKLTTEEMYEKIIPWDILSSILSMINDNVISKKEVMMKIEEYAKKYKGEKDGISEGNQ